MARPSLFRTALWLGLMALGLGAVTPRRANRILPKTPPSTPAAATSPTQESGKPSAAPEQAPTAVPGNFCLRLLPGWTVRPDGNLLRLIAPAGPGTPAAEFRLELDVLPGALKSGAPLPHSLLIQQAEARLSLFMRDLQEDETARQIFTTPNAAGVVYRFQGVRKRDGRATACLVYALIGGGGARTALLTPLESSPEPPAFSADLEALMHALRFLPGGPAPEAATQEFSGRLTPHENHFYLWLRDRGDAEAVWETVTPHGDAVSARFAGSYALSGRLLRAALLRTGGENPYVTRLLELELQPSGGNALQGSARLDDARRITVDGLQLVSVKFAPERP